MKKLWTWMKRVNMDFLCWAIWGIVSFHAIMIWLVVVLLSLKSGLMALPEIIIWVILGWDRLIRRMGPSCKQGHFVNFIAPPWMPIFIKQEVNSVHSAIQVILEHSRADVNKIKTHGHLCCRSRRENGSENVLSIFNLWMGCCQGLSFYDKHCYFGGNPGHIHRVVFNDGAIDFAQPSEVRTPEAIIFCFKYSSQIICCAPLICAWYLRCLIFKVLDKDSLESEVLTSWLRWWKNLNYGNAV